MELVRSLNDISRRMKHFSNGYVLGDGIMIMVTFKTKAEIIEKVLPPPLEPAPASIGVAYITEFNKTNFGATYSEGGLYISAQYRGEVGKYCLSMPVTNDMAMIWGREIYGYPKKIAETIYIKREGNSVNGICIRKGIPIIKIKVNLTKQGETKNIPQPTPNFLFKSFWDIDPKSVVFNSSPRLIKQQNEIDWGNAQFGKGELTLSKSKYDPIYEIPVEKVLTACYAEDVEARMQPGKIIAKVDPVEFLPYSFIKYDWELVLQRSNPIN